MPSIRLVLDEIFHRLFDHFGPQHWWPGRTRFEIIVGAILTQNTNWGNVERAIANLRRAGVLNPSGLARLTRPRLARLIQPSGYYNIKADRLKHFVKFLMREYDGRLAKMSLEPWPVLRSRLLNVNGIGPETADSILLYAFNKPVFVIDAYTFRIMSRHKIFKGPVDYAALQNLFMSHLKSDCRLYNEYHALLVRVGKEFCRPRPRCHACPLKEMLPRDFTTVRGFDIMEGR